jgi:zinc and cadmium transporter
MSGGIFAIKNKQRLHYILGFTAGIILGVIAFDILPETFRIAEQFHIDPTKPMVALVVGFLLFHILEKTVLIHHAHETEYGIVSWTASALDWVFRLTTPLVLPLP